MIVLRAEDEIDAGRPPHHFGTLGLRHAAGYSHDHPAAALSFRCFKTTNFTELRIDLFSRFFPNVASVEDH